VQHGVRNGNCFGEKKEKTKPASLGAYEEPDRWYRHCINSLRLLVGASGASFTASLSSSRNECGVREAAMLFVTSRTVRSRSRTRFLSGEVGIEVTLRQPVIGCRRSPLLLSYACAGPHLRPSSVVLHFAVTISAMGETGAVRVSAARVSKVQAATMDSCCATSPPHSPQRSAAK
jgi:hypothetical protein